MQQEAEEAQTYLQEVEQTLTERTRIKLPLQIAPMLIRSLDIAETLMRVAASDEEEDVFEQSGPCDLIALATHGRSGLAHWVKGLLNIFH